MPVRVVRVEVRTVEGALRDKALIAGYHGFGLVGYLAVRHLVRALGGRRVGYVISPYMRQVVNVGPEGLVVPYELYDVGPAVVFLPNVPLSERDLIRVPYALAEASISDGARMALLIGGLDASYKRGGGVMRYAATKCFLSRYSELVKGLHSLEEGLSIIGPLAAMLAYYEACDFPSVAVLPYADPHSVDPLAAKVAVDFVSRVINVEVDAQELLRLAEEKARFEREIEELRRNVGHGDKPPTPPMFYV